MDKTTLILGAGASVDYGYPTGAKLIEEVGVRSFHNIFSDRISPVEWKKRLIEAQPPSIDFFMSLDEDLMHSVKPYIFLYLLTKESNGKTLKLDYSEHWYYDYFNDKITKNIEETEQNLSQTNVITFNYDRSLEYYLSRVIKQRCYHKDTDYNNAFNLMNKMKIHHVYGRLPYFDSEAGPKTSGLEYERISILNLSNSNANQHVGLVNGKDVLFKICYETVEQVVKEKNKELIQEAKNILFLGFGFHNENMEVLNHNFNDTSKRYMASGYGLRESKIEELRKGMYNLKIENMKTHEFIKHLKSEKAPETFFG